MARPRRGQVASATTAGKLRRLWELFQPEDRVLITIWADPDAIACAVAFKRLLWRRVATVAISNINKIKRGDNLTLINAVKVPLVPVAKINPADYTKTVILDSQPHHHEAFARFKYDVVIDHHPYKEGLEASFIDIHPDYGATATLMTEYLRSAAIRPSVRLATALFYAIKTDTASFTRNAREEDIRAFRYLFTYASKGLVRKIELSEVPAADIKYYRRALNRLQIRRRRAYAHLSDVPGPDICVLVADFLLRINEVFWSVVSGIYDGRLVVILRNDGYRKDAGRAAERAFGSLGLAGGHKEMARAEIPLENIKDSLPGQRVVDYERFVIKSLAHSIKP